MVVMPLGRNLKALALAIGMSLLLGACDKQVQQTITGTLASSTGPTANMHLRLYESFKTCEGTFVEGRTDAQGAFKFRTVSTRGGISVVTQPIALCVEESGRWSPLWSTVTGGGAESMVLTCGPQAVGRESRSAADEFCDLMVR
jgi:hypothetical protein